MASNRCIYNILCYTASNIIQSAPVSSGRFGNDDYGNYLVGDCVVDIVNIYDDSSSNDYNSGNGIERYVDVFGGGLIRTTTSADFNQYISFDDSLDTIASGSANVYYDYDSIGGAQVSGNANFVNYTSKGGAKCSGVARIVKTAALFEQPQLIQSQFLQSKDLADVSVFRSTEIVYNETGGSGARISGAAIVNGTSSIPVSGGVVVSGSHIFGLGMAASGTIDAAGLADTKQTNFYLKTISWKVDKNIFIEKGFSWNTGEVPLSWYRVEGKCASSVNCDTHGFQLADGCGYSTYIQVIAARGLPDLCDKLKEGFLVKAVIWPLKSIQKRNNPVYKTDTDTSCDIFEEQDFCHIPECKDFCLDESVTFSAELSMRVEDAFLSYVGEGLLRLTGVATTDTDGYVEDRLYTAGGGLFLSGLADTDMVAEYTYETFGGSFVFGEADIVCPNYAYESNLNVVVGGTAVPTSSNYEYIAPTITEFDEEFDDDYSTNYLVTRGAGFYGVGLTATGAISVTGSGVSSINIPHIASGYLFIEGSASSISPAYTNVGTGDLEVGGEADYISSYGGEYIQDATINMSIVKVYLGYIEDSASDSLVADTTTVVSCGCSSIPLSLSLGFNFNTENQLSRFIKRNSIVYPSSVSIVYRSLTNSWHASHHFKGVGEQDNNNERWLINFIWSCSESIESISEGGFWSLKVNISKENLDTSEEVVTRMSFIMPTITFCRVPENKVKITYNVKKKTIVTDFSFAEVDYFEDNIGLFKNKYWANNPGLILAITDSAEANPINRYDYAKFFPKNTTSIFS